MEIEINDSYCIGNVLRIIDERTIIVSVGKPTLSKGNTIQVYEIVDTIKDLEGNDIDLFLHIKDTLDVIEVEKHYSVCRKMEYHETTLRLALSPILEQKNVEYIPLNIDKQDIRPLRPKDPLIRVGDPIKFA